jgi:hypothetical protein
MVHYKINNVISLKFCFLLQLVPGGDMPET